MNLDDESLLTAYLDDELDEPQRRAVEAALLADPALAARLDDLRRVQGLVAGLSRPGTEFDLAWPVVAKLDARRPDVWVLPFRARPIRKPSLFAMVSSLLIAASVFVNVQLALRPRPLPPGVVTLTALPPSQVRPVRPLPESTETKLAQIETAPTASADRAATSSAKALVSGPDASEIKNEHERQRLLDYLDDATVRRIFVTGDKLETAASDVDEAVKNSGRRTPVYGRITVNQGIIVDPEEPGGAIVFILVMNETELNALRDRIETKLKMDVEEEGETPASVVTLLADIGQVDVVYGSPLPQVQPLPSNMAFSLAMRKDEAKDVAGELDPQTGVVRPTPVPLPAAAPGAANSGAPANGVDPHPGPATPTNPDARTTVLVWVRSRPRAGH
jgi:hypothetical protein